MNPLLFWYMCSYNDDDDDDEDNEDDMLSLDIESEFPDWWTFPLGAAIGLATGIISYLLAVHLCA